MQVVTLVFRRIPSNKIQVMVGGQKERLPFENFELRLSADKELTQAIVDEVKAEMEGMSNGDHFELHNAIVLPLE